MHRDEWRRRREPKIESITNTNFRFHFPLYKQQAPMPIIQAAVVTQYWWREGGNLWHSRPSSPAKAAFGRCGRSRLKIAGLDSRAINPLGHPLPRAGTSFIVLYVRSSHLRYCCHNMCVRCGFSMVATMAAFRGHWVRVIVV